MGSDAVGAACPSPFAGEAIPKHPVLWSSTFRRRRVSPGIPTLLDAADVRFLRLGRIALSAALQMIGIGPGDKVLLPAYHCVSMVEPALKAGATPVFYRIAPGALVDLDDLERRMVGARAIIAPHYFGFHQPMPDIRRIADRHGAALIEDCAHCLFGEIDGTRVGGFGDYAIASPWKFLPVNEGGCLVVNRNAGAPLTIRGRAPSEEAKALLNLIEVSLAYGRLPRVGMLARPLLALADYRNRRRRARRGPRAPKDENPRRADATPLAAIDAMTAVCRTIVRRADLERVVTLRRQYYRELLEAWRELPGARPLHAELPDNVVPQVFPLVVEAPEARFAPLKAAGVPIIRFGEYLWEGLEPGTCRVTEALSRQVFQFPCHQELRPDEVRWLAATVRDVLHRTRHC